MVIIRWTYWPVAGSYIITGICCAAAGCCTTGCWITGCWGRGDMVGISRWTYWPVAGS